MQALYWPQVVLEAQQAERQRVARELHDGVNPLLASVDHRLRHVVSKATALTPVAKEMLARCSQLLNQALEENRRIIRNLPPGELTQHGLAPALRNLCKATESRSHFVIKTSIARQLPRLPAQVELHVFRIAQEALNNVVKHACATNVHLHCVQRGSWLVLKIRDDGRGFDPQRVRVPSDRRWGAGLVNMRERAALLGQTCQVHSAPNQGTTITLRIECPDTKPHLFCTEAPPLLSSQ